MKLTQTEKDIVEREYTRLTGIINYITELTNQQNTADRNIREFIVQAGIEIYKKM